MSGRKWTEEEKKAMSDRAKERKAARAASSDIPETYTMPSQDELDAPPKVTSRDFKEVDWKEVEKKAAASIRVGDDYTLMQDRMAIPPMLKKLEDSGEYCYRWLNVYGDRFHEQLDAAIPWEIVTRSNSSVVPDRYFDTDGAIHKGRDLILARMSRKAHDLRQQMIWRMSAPPTKPRDGEFREGLYFEPEKDMSARDLVVAAEDTGGRMIDYGLRPKTHGVPAGTERDAPDSPEIV